MLSTSKKLATDFLGLARVCGVLTACRWLGCVGRYVVAIAKEGNLQAADKAMGEGPFSIALSQYGVSFAVLGDSAITGIREMYVRDTYLGGGLLRIHDGDIVVDLGANMGNFTNLALSCGKQVRVVAVEPSLAMNASFRRSVSLNSGYMSRVNLARAFLGEIPQTVQRAIDQDVNYHGAPWMSEADLIKEGHLTKVDFLKCDIEGGEFQLLTADSKLLAMTQTIAIEVHAFAGDVHEFIERLRRCGFGIVATKYDPDGTATVLGKRQGEQQISDRSG